jgi:hypothetical protein
MSDNIIVREKKNNNWQRKDQKIFKNKKGGNMKNRMCKWQCCVSESDFGMRIRIQLLKHWRQKPKLSAMFSETITCKWYKYPQLKLKYTLGATGSLRYFRIITERSLILVFCSTLFAKFMDPDPHRDFLPGSGSAKNKRNSVTLGKG